MFGNRLIQASRAANVADPQLRTDLIAFVHNCTVYDLQDGTIDRPLRARSTDIWSLMGTPNPARFSTYGNPVQVDTCPNAYTYLAARLPAEVAHALRSMLAFQLNPRWSRPPPSGHRRQIEQAYARRRSPPRPRARGPAAPEHHDQPGAGHEQQPRRPEAQRPGRADDRHRRANATASTNSAFLTMGKIAEQALPLVGT